MSTQFKKVRGLAVNINFAHSVFALPFAVLTAFIVSEGWPPLLLFFVGLLAIVMLRAFGLSANRLIDARIDAMNLRTHARPIPAGAISRRDTLIFMVITLLTAVLLLVFFDFEPTVWAAIPVLVIIMVVYPYLKRWTWLCHFGVGLLYVLIPITVSLALIGTVSFGIVLLGLAAALWVTGFDVLYGINDYDFDRANKINSIPARFGIARAIWVTRFLHLLSAILLFLCGVLLNLGIAYYIGATIVTVLLLYENKLVSVNDLTRLDQAFFTMNGVIAVVLCVATVVDVLV